MIVIDLPEENEEDFNVILYSSTPVWTPEIPWDLKSLLIGGPDNLG
jgi:hypothetical protein